MTKRRWRGRARWLTWPVVAASAWVGVVSSPVSAQTGIPSPSPMVVIDTGQRTYRVPYAYLNFRPPQDRLNQVNKWANFSFAFWMPDGRPVKGGDAASLVLVRPSEPGQPPPGPNEYIVWFTRVTPWSDPDAGRQPSEQLANYLSGGANNYKFSEQNGMLAIEPKFGSASNFDLFFGIQRVRSDIGITMLLLCSKSGPFVVQALCAGSGSSRNLSVTYQIVLPKDRIDQGLQAHEVGSVLLQTWATE